MWSDLRRYRRTSSTRRKLLWEALRALAGARLVMACVPFRRIAAWLGTPGTESPMTAPAEEVLVAQEIGWAVGVLARRVPWDGRCLAQALAATRMLRRRGLEGTISFGVSQGEPVKFAAHAWVRVGSYIVTGAPGHERFKTLMTISRGQS